jgi:hypothetical protein
MLGARFLTIIDLTVGEYGCGFVLHSDGVTLFPGFRSLGVIFSRLIVLIRLLLLTNQAASVVLLPPYILISTITAAVRLVLNPSAFVI